MRPQHGSTLFRAFAERRRRQRFIGRGFADLQLLPIDVRSMRTGRPTDSQADIGLIEINKSNRAVDGDLVSRAE